MSKPGSTNSLSKKSSHLKISFTVALFVCVVLVFYLTSDIGISRVKKSIEEQYIEDGKNLVRVYSIAVQNMISQAYLMLDVYSQIDEIKYGTTEDAEKWLLSHRYMQPANFMNSYYCDSSGIACTNTGFRIDIKDRAYYKEIFAGNTIYHLDTAVISKTTGRKIFHVSKAIYTDDGAIKGIVGGSIELAELQKLLSEAQFSNNMRPFILDENGLFLSHVNSDYLMKTFTPSPEEFNAYSSEAIATGIYKELKTTNIEGDNVHLFTEPIKTTPWIAGLSIPDSEIYKTYNKLEIGKRWVLATIIISGFVFYFLCMSLLRLIRKQYVSQTENDPVTELYSRQNFEKIATEIINENPEASYILIEIDFVGFKFLNKNYGENVANETLVTFGKILKELCGLYGGIASRGYADHFYYFNRITSVAKASSALKISQLKIDSAIQNAKYPFTPKYGISYMTPEKDGDINSGKKTIQELIGEATMAKESIKKDININAATYNTDMAEKVLQTQKIERCMEKALENQEFYVLYQPKIELNSDKIIGAEALARWHSSELGYLTPDKFIPIFENNGFIKKMDFEIYEIVFRFIKKQLDEKKPIVPISINMSRVHIDASEFIKEFMERFRKYDIPTKYVEIEILERSVSTENSLLLEITDELHKLGFTVAMDDFGSGESSLNMLNSVPIDVLKFDQNFLRNNPNDLKNEKFITSLVNMAQQLHKKTVFEGVETEKQRDFLKSIKCDSVQGYFYSKPLPEDDFVNFLKSHI